MGAGGTVDGTVTVTPGGAPIAGATVALGSRTTTTNGTGQYAFTGLPAGTYPAITASAAGYVPATQVTVVVTDGGTTTKDFALSAAPASDCPTDTSQANFQTGAPTNVDLNTSPGNVVLSNLTVVDQSNSAGTTTGTGFGTPAWTGQTFVSGLTGPVTKVDVQLFCNGCGATPPNLTLSIRATSAGLPTGADLASATIPGSLFASGTTTSATATFGSPPTLTSGTQYAVILRPVSVPAGSGYFWIRSSPSTYANGSRVLSADSGGTWSADTTRDYNFKVYVDTGYAANGNLVSSNKDSNPAPGFVTAWTTLSWTATTPAGTTVRFQAAGSNNAIGPFNFVGPDGTAATFFTTSGASLAQFNGFRYLQTKAYLETTNNTVTPTLHDVTVCFSTACGTQTPTASNGGPYCEGATIQLSTPAVAGATYSWTGPTGFSSSLQNPTRTNATPADGGLYAVTVTVGCPSAPGTTNVVVNATPATPTASNGGPYCEGSTIQLSTPTVAGATYSWTGPNGFTSSAQNPTRLNATPADAGLYSVTITVDGCSSAAGTTNVVVNATPATPTASNGGPYCEGATISLSTPTVAGATYSWTGPNGFTSSAQNPTRPNATPADAGLYSVTTTVNGCSSAAGTTNVVVNATPATPTASNGGPYCEGATISLSTPTVAGATYSWTGPNGFTSSAQNPTRPNATPADAGLYSVTITVDGCPSAAGTTNVVVNTTPATPTASNGGPYCEGATISLSTPMVAGATYSWTGPNGFASSAQNPTRPNATLADAGLYSVTITVDGCSSAAGTTNVVVNTTPATPTASNGGPYCEGATISLSTPTVAGATYSWTGPNGFTSSDQNPTRPNATLADAGTYSVTITVDGCPSAAGTTNVVVNATPATPSAANGGPYIEGDTIALSTPTVAGATYSWTGPNGFTSSDQNPTRPNATLADAGTYSVTVTVDGCTSAAGTTNVIVNPDGNYFAVTPCRLLDTRQAGQGPPLTSLVPRILTVAGSCGVPASATAVAINVTAVGSTAYGHITGYPGDAALPATSTVNFLSGQTRANNAIIPLSVSGELAFRAVIDGGGTVHLVVDVAGYFQ